MGQLKRITGIPIHSLNKHKLCSMVKHALCLTWAPVFCLRYTAFSQRIIAIFAKTFREIKGVFYHDATENAAWLYGTTELGAQSQNSGNVVSCPPNHSPPAFLKIWRFHCENVLGKCLIYGYFKGQVTSFHAYCCPFDPNSRLVILWCLESYFSVGEISGESGTWALKSRDMLFAICNLCLKAERWILLASFLFIRFFICGFRVIVEHKALLEPTDARSPGGVDESIHMV